MSEQQRHAVSPSQPTPAVVVHLLDVVAERRVDHALSDMEQVIACLRADAEVAAEAREVLSTASTTVLREAVRLRAARIQPARIETAR